MGITSCGGGYLCASLSAPRTETKRTLLQSVKCYLAYIWEWAGIIIINCVVKVCCMLIKKQSLEVNTRNHLMAFFLYLLGVWGPGFEGWCDKCNGKWVGFWKTTEVVSRSGFRRSSNQPVSCSPYICETIQAHQVWTDVWNFFTHNIMYSRLYSD